MNYNYKLLMTFFCEIYRLVMFSFYFFFYIYLTYFILLYLFFFRLRGEFHNHNQLHDVSRTQQGRPSVKTLRPPLSVGRQESVGCLEALRVEWQNSTLRFASTPERRNENINVNKYFISSSGDRTHNQSV